MDEMTEEQKLAAVDALLSKATRSALEALGETVDIEARLQQVREQVRREPEEE